MKKYIFYFVLCFPFWSNAQTDPEELPTIEHVVEHLNFSEVNTGLLWNISPQLLDLSLLDGQTISENNPITINTYGLAYATLTGGAINNASLPADPAVYRNATSTNGVIPITVAAFHYNAMKEDALDLGLFTLTEDQLYDVANRPESPYEEKTTFFASSIVNATVNTTLSFQIPSNLYLSNFTETVSTLKIDLSDGNGYQNINFGTNISADYGDFVGEKNIALEFTYSDGTVLKAHFILKIFPNPNDDIPVDPRYDPTPVTSIVVPGGVGDIFTLCQAPNTEIRKPFIFVEGFNPEVPGIEGFQNQTFNHMLNQLSFFTNGNFLINFLEDEGFDLIYVDFDDPTASIQDNAAVLTAIIEEINEQKAANGSLEKNVVFGESMGGLISKYALLNMENSGIDHETETLMTFDSPLRGANIPLSMQLLVQDMHDLQVTALFGIVAYNVRDFVPEIEELENLLNSPAPKQMLINNAYHNELNNEHDALMAEIEAFGAPQDFKMIALSNGSLIGEPQIKLDGTALGQDEIMVGIDFNSLAVGNIVNEAIGGTLGGILGGAVNILFNAATLIPLARNAKIKLRLRTMSSESKEVYEFKVRVKVLFGFYALKFKNKVTTTEDEYKLLPLDNAPGGIQGAEAEITDELQLLIDAGVIDFNATTFCFIPTVSALDIKSPENQDLFQDLSDEMTALNGGLTLVERYTGSIDDSEESFGFEQHNQFHAAFTPRNAALFLFAFRSENSLAGLFQLTSTYNFGDAGLDNLPFTATFRKTSNKIKSSISVTNGGNIWINRIDRISFISNEDNPDNLTSSEIDFFISQDDCNGLATTVRLFNNTEFRIGDWTGSDGNTANVYVQENARIQVGNDASLIIQDRSQLIIQNGGEVTVQSGGLLSAEWQSQVIIENGGTLTIEGGGQLRPTVYAQIIVEPGGKLILEDGAVLQMWGGGAVEDGLNSIHIMGAAEVEVDGEIEEIQGTLEIQGEIDWSGNGFLQFDAGHILDIADGVDFELDGVEKGVRFMRLNKGAKLIPQAHTRFLNGEIEYAPNSSIEIGQDEKITMIEMQLSGLEEVSPSNQVVALRAENPKHLRIFESDFQDISFPIETYNVNDITLAVDFWIRNSIFRDCGIAIFVGVSDSKLYVSGSEFYNGTALLAYDIPEILFSECILEGEYASQKLLEKPIDVSKGAILIDVGAFIFSGGEIRNHGVGIHGFSEGDLSFANVFIQNQATLRENGAGVWIDKGGFLQPDLDWGLVKVDCANFIENGIAVAGEDALLQIDAYENSDFDLPRSNHFQRKLDGFSTMFDVCFVDRDITTVEATGNFWGTENIGSEPVIQHSLSDDCLFPTVALNTENPASQASDDCPTSNSGGSGGPISSGGTNVEVAEVDANAETLSKDCEIIVNNEERKLHIQNFEAFNTFNAEIEEDLENKSYKDLFAPIAAIPNDIRNQSSDICKQYIDVARTMVNLSVFVEGARLTEEPDYVALTEQFWLPETLGNLSEKVEEELLVFPNPTENNFRIYLETGNYEILIMNALGGIIAKQKASGMMEFLTKDWSKGMYFIQVTDLENLKMSTVKISVQ